MPKSPPISPTKGHHPRFPVLPHVSRYQEAVSTVLNAVRIRHLPHGERVSSAMTALANALYQKVMAEMYTHDPVDGGVDARIQFNDSVSRLRTIHNQTLKRIRQLTKPAKAIL